MSSVSYSVYVLKSKKNAKRYIGYTSKPITNRLIEHNEGSNRYTKNNIPYELLYFEQNFCKECATNREKFLKSGQGRKLLDKILD